MHHYNLPTNMVAIDTVLYSTDGTTFDDGELEPSTIHDFHNDHYKWSELRGVEPGYYALLGCPGASGSKIVVYPALSTVTSNAIRVRYLRCRAEAGTNFLADTAQGWVEDEVYIPHVMAQLHAQRDKRLFRRYWAEYLINVNKLRGASRSRYGETKDSIGAFGDYPASGGQL